MESGSGDACFAEVDVDVVNCKDKETYCTLW